MPNEKRKRTEPLLLSNPFCALLIVATTQLIQSSGLAVRSYYLVPTYIIAARVR